MVKGRDRTVYQRDDGSWAIKRYADRESSVHHTQSAAARKAERLPRSQGGGELAIKGGDGKIRSKDTIAPGRDPNPPRNREH